MACEIKLVGAILKYLCFCLYKAILVIAILNIINIIKILVIIIVLCVYSSDINLSKYGKINLQEIIPRHPQPIEKISATLPSIFNGELE